MNAEIAERAMISAFNWPAIKATLESCFNPTRSVIFASGSDEIGGLRLSKCWRDAFTMLDGQRRLWVYDEVYVRVIAVPGIDGNGSLSTVTSLGGHPRLSPPHT
ncbi:hypothetical protein EDB19DRAFT_1132417 [Suillus lakei]|nr:hypothetical protein EDB19DRAFT_1132417 [Suillus lakei]